MTERAIKAASRRVGLLCGDAIGDGDAARDPLQTYTVLAQTAPRVFSRCLLHWGGSPAHGGDGSASTRGRATEWNRRGPMAWCRANHSEPAPFGLCGPWRPATRQARSGLTNDGFVRDIHGLFKASTRAGERLPIRPYALEWQVSGAEFAESVVKPRPVPDIRPPDLAAGKPNFDDTPTSDRSLSMIRIPMSCSNTAATK